MSLEPDSSMADDLIALVARDQDRIIARWSELLVTAQPNLFRSLDQQAWRGRMEDALVAMREALTSPERLRYPMFGAHSGSGRLIELGERAVAAHLEDGHELHELLGVYYLLEEALVEAIDASGLGPRRLPATMLVDRFIKQLSIAMSMAMTQRRAETLETAVAERTRQLEHTLKQQDEFVSFVSHEIRTGLTAILGACDYLSEIAPDALSADQSRFVRIIERSGVLINTLVNDILDYAKLESGRVHLRLEPVHLREVATDAIALLEAKWAPKGLDVRLEMSPELPEVSGDRIRLQQIFLNLLANAIRFSPDFGVITVRGGTQGGKVYFEIADEGPGIPRADRARVFRRFEQSIQRGQGTGLGLPIVKVLAELHGGKVDLRPATPRGSIFRVTLPVPVREKAAR